MNKQKKLIIIANWKMNPVSVVDAKEKFQKIRNVSRALRNVQTVVCPPFIFLEQLSKLVRGSKCVIGAQDVFWEDTGAYTGEISSLQLDRLDVSCVILGHSERRALGETNEIVNRKIKACCRNNLRAIVCIGETERDTQGEYFRFLKQQIKLSLMRISPRDFSKLIIAYEPVWAIGVKAKQPDTPEDLLEISIFIRKILSDQFGKSLAMSVSILYGGSVEDRNAEAFLKSGSAQGLLVGRASLDPKTFGNILKIADKI